jgi:peptidoglycan hydrolase-like protein with peptidoglycan-binding domain
MANVLKKGSKGEDVKVLQQNLGKLGYAVSADGDFGGGTEAAVLQLQKAFGYTVDGMVGEGTQFLINQQIGLGWKANG